MTDKNKTSNRQQKRDEKLSAKEERLQEDTIVRFVLWIEKQESYTFAGAILAGFSQREYEICTVELARTNSINSSASRSSGSVPSSVQASRVPMTYRAWSGAYECGRCGTRIPGPGGRHRKSARGYTKEICDLHETIRLIER